MKRNFLITTAAAALLAGTMFAAAQGQGQSQSQGGARIQGEAQGQVDKKQGQADKKQDKGQIQRSQKSEQPKTQGQGGSQNQGQGSQKSEPRTQGQGSGQTQTQQGSEPKQAPAERDDQGKGSKQGQTQKNGADGKQGAQKDAQTGAGGGSSVTLTTEQRTKIRTTVLHGNNAPRVTNVNFSIRVGTAVPRDRVRLVAVSPILVEIHPEWRGYMYFIVDDQIVIVDPRSHKIVAVLVV